MSDAGSSGSEPLTLPALGAHSIRALGRLPLPSGERVGVRGLGSFDRFEPPHPRLRRDLSPPGRGGVCRALVALLTFVVVTAAFALDFPALSGRVVDDAGVLDQATHAAVTQKLADLEAKS